MAICKICGAEVGSDAKFCQKCGTQVEKQHVEEPLIIDRMHTCDGIMDVSMKSGIGVICAAFVLAIIGIIIESDALFSFGAIGIFIGLIVFFAVWAYYYSKLSDKEKEQFKLDYKERFKSKNKKQKNTASDNGLALRQGRRTCIKCHSSNIQYQTVTEKKSMGCGTLLWYFILFITIFGWFILVPLIFNRKDDVVTYAVCQDCGHRWEVD